MRRLMTLLLLALLTGTSCSEEQYTRGVAAEAAYVDLVYHLSRTDTLASRAAAATLREKVDALRPLAHRPLRDHALDERLFHLDRASCAFLDALISVDAGTLNLAEIQLDRAVFELQAADAAVLGELYVGSIYDFAAGWMALAATVREAAPTEFVDPDCLAYPLVAWKRMAHLRPDPLLYPELVRDPGPFLAAHAKLNLTLAALTRKHAAGRPVTGGEVTAASEDFWNLLVLFGTKHLRATQDASVPASNRSATPINPAAAPGPTR